MRTLLLLSFAAMALAMPVDNKKPHFADVGEHPRFERDAMKTGHTFTDEKKPFDETKPKRDTSKVSHFDDKKDFDQPKDRHTRDTDKMHHFADEKKPFDETHKPKRDVEKSFDGTKNEGHHFDQPKDRQTRDTEKAGQHFADKTKEFDETSKPKRDTSKAGQHFDDKKDFDGASSKPKRDTAKAGQHFDDKKDFAEEKNFDQPGRHTRDTAKAGQHFDDMKKPSFNDEVHKPKRDVEKNFDGMKNEGHHFDQPKDRHTRDTDKMHHFTDEKKPFDGASSKPKRDTSKAGQHFDDMKKPSFDGMKDSHH